jgi:hypothetical protein
MRLHRTRQKKSENPSFVTLAMTFELSNCLSVQRQAAAVRMVLHFFGFGVLAFEIGQGHIQRLVAQADSNHRVISVVRVGPSFVTTL